MSDLSVGQIWPVGLGFTPSRPHPVDLLVELERLTPVSTSVSAKETPGSLCLGGWISSSSPSTRTVCTLGCSRGQTGSIKWWEV